MDFNCALVVGPAGLASTERLGQAMLAADLLATVCTDAQALERARAGSADHPEPAIVLLGPELAQPIGVARSLRARWPNTHLLFVQHGVAITPMRKALSHAPMLGYHWSLSESDDPSLPQQIGNAVAAARRRTRLRTTLDRVNLGLAATPAAEVSAARQVMSEHYLSNFLAQASESIIAADMKGRVLYWNASVLQLLALDDARLPGMDLAGLPFWTPALAAAVAALDGSGTVRCEVAYGRGELAMTLEVGCSAVHDRQGAPVGITLVIRDTSERQRLLDIERDEHRLTESMLLRLERMVEERTASLQHAEHALHQSQKLESLGKLTGGVAHDFNNILQVIGGNLELLRQQPDDGAASGARITAAFSAVDRGARLASQLLAFARKQPLQPVATNLARVVREMDGMLRRVLGETVEIECVIGGGLWMALVDRNHLENVILNLAINARDAMEGSGLLTIELGNAQLDEHYADTNAEAAPGQYVMLAVSDTGKGMAPDVAARAFEPFYTTKPEGQGTGLGLSMAYGFVKQSSGHIKIYSELNNGTTLKVYLPRIQQAEAAVPDLRPLPVVGGTETILVVEDEPAVRTTVVDLLSGLGYQVLKAGDGQSGLTVLQSGMPIDLLFTDVVMPGPVRSIDMARQAATLHPGIQVLFTSGYTQNAIVHGGRLDPGVELISKPYRREELARRIRALLDRRPPPPVVARKTILVVEDNDDAREMLCELLDVLGYATVSALTAEDALVRLQEHRVDVLLTDVGLPGIQGDELARRAHAADPALRIVFTSGYGVVEAAGFPSRSLPKPYTMQDLQGVLDSV